MQIVDVDAIVDMIIDGLVALDAENKSERKCKMIMSTSVKRTMWCDSPS